MLGMHAKDVITGFEGIITGHCSYITGCDQCLVQPKKSKTGDYIDGKWFDKNRLVIRTEFEPIVLETDKDKGACDPAPVK